MCLREGPTVPVQPQGRVLGPACGCWEWQCLPCTQQEWPSSVAPRIVPQSPHLCSWCRWNWCSW